MKAFVKAYRAKNNLNTIEETCKLIKKNLYDESLEDDDPFFYNEFFFEFFDWF